MGMATGMAMEPSMISKRSALWTICLLATGGATAQTQADAEAATKRSVTVVTRVSATETLTNNVSLSSTSPQSEQITELSPGIRINIERPRLKTYFDYALTEVVYAQGSAPRQTQNALNTFGTLEAVDNWAFVDFSGSISQQAVSAFGTPSIDNTSINPNRAEVSTYRVSPYVRGRLGDVADYEARHTRAVTQTDAAAASGLTMVDSVLKIASQPSVSKLGWLADLGQQSASYSITRPAEATHFNLGATYAISSQVKVYAIAGREANNYISVDKQSYATNSLGLDWVPSDRTKLSALFGHRSFGDFHSLSFEHRSARTVWKFTDFKDISSDLSPNGNVGPGLTYDLLFSQFATLEPDPIARAQLVNAYLQANGISPTAQAISGFFTTALSLQRRQDLSFALLGVRDSIIFIASRSESSRLDTLSAGIDDLSNLATVRQLGFNLNYAHRLTPDYSLGVLLSQQKNSSATGIEESRLRSLNVNLTGKVGRQSSANVGARRVVSDSISGPYVETALIGNLNVQF